MDDRIDESTDIGVLLSTSEQITRHDLRRALIRDQADPRCDLLAADALPGRARRRLGRHRHPHDVSGGSAEGVRILGKLEADA